MNIMKTTVAAVASAALLAAAPVLAQSPARVSVSVDAAQPGYKLNKHIFGQFAEHLGTGIYPGIWVGEDSSIPNTRGIRNDVVAALKELKMPNVRWPGGCFADDYNWRWGIGPKENRHTSMNMFWGAVTEPNVFGTHEFFDFIEQVESNAYVSGNVGSGHPREMSDFLEYMTADADTTLSRERRANGRDKPFQVPFFGVGNETWGCGGNMTAEYSNDEYRRFVTYARNFDPTQKMVRIASGANADDVNWTEVMMRTWRDSPVKYPLDAISLHNYTGFNQWPPHQASTGFGTLEYAEVIRSVVGMDALVGRHVAAMDKYDPQKRVWLAVDEWGAWYAPDPGTNPGFLQQQNSQRDAVTAAMHFHIFFRYGERVQMANIAQLINVLQAMILTDNEKMLTTPTYHAFKLYIPFQDATSVPVTYDAGTFTSDGITLPRADIYAAKGTDGKLYLAIVNIDPKSALEVDASVLGLKATSATGETLAAPYNAYNTFDAPDTVTPKAYSAKASGGKLVLKVAPSSVTVVQLN